MGRHNQRAEAQQFRVNLRACIRHQGWTQRQAAVQFGLDYPTLRKYLNSGLANETPNNRPRLERICQRLGISETRLLWAPNLKPRRPKSIYTDEEAESLTYQLKLLLSQFRERPAVEKVCNAIENAFSSLVCEMNEAKERARGGSYVDRDTAGKASKSQRRDMRAKKYDDE